MRRNSPERRIDLLLVIALVFLIGLGATAAAVRSTRTEVISEARARFEGGVDRLESEIARRIDLAEHALKAGRATYAARGELTRAEFRAFVETLKLQEDLPWVRGLGLIERVPRDTLAAYVERVRRDGAPGFTVRKNGKGPDALVVRFLEPEKANAQALGLDFTFEAVRREAGERAIREGRAALSGRLTLVQDAEQRAGWAMVLPVYAQSGAKKVLIGLLCAPIVAREMLADVKSSVLRDRVEFRLFDGPVEARSLMFDSRDAAAAGVSAPPPLFVSERRMTLGGRGYTLVAENSEEPDLATHGSAHWLVGGAGIAMSLALAFAVGLRMSRQDRRRALSAERLMRAITDNLPARVSFWDRDVRCRFVNRGFCEFVGREPEDLIGMDAAQVFGAEQVELARPHIARALGGEQHMLELQETDPGGRQRSWHVHYVPNTELGQVFGLLILALDITDLKEARDHAVEASQAKTRFLSNMSHELRTPMNAVMGMLALLRSTSLDARQRDYATKADSAARSLLELLNDVLDLSKIEAGRMTLDLRPFDLREMVNDLAVVLTSTVHGKPVALHFEIDPVLPQRLVGDDMRLRQILVNLGGNAVKFTERGEVEVSLRHLASDERTVSMQVSVEDTGIGITPEQAARLFHAFGQASEGTARRYGGTGLGLDISQQLARLMGSELKLHSTAGQGSRFWFDITLEVAQEAPARQARTVKQVSSRPLKGLRLLLVEDNVINQQIASELLSSRGARVEVVGDGAQAVAWIRRAPERFDAVLMDMLMPVMGGLEATRIVREELGNWRLPIIAMTANALERDRAECLAAGMNDHVGKPFEVQQLVDILLRHVARGDGAVTTNFGSSAPAPLDSTTHAGLGDGPLAVLDREAAIARLSDDMELYDRLVPSFVESAQGIARRLPSLLHSQSREESVRLMHTLKGTAATMGCDRLSAAASAAEKTLAGRGRAGVTAEAALQQVGLAIAQMLAAFGVSSGG